MSHTQQPQPLYPPTPPQNPGGAYPNAQNGLQNARASYAPYPYPPQTSYASAQWQRNPASAPAQGYPQSTQPFPQPVQPNASQQPVNPQRNMYTNNQNAMFGVPANAYTSQPNRNPSATQNGSHAKQGDSSSGGTPPRKPRSSRRKWILIIASVLLVCALGFGGYVGSIMLKLQPYETVFLPNIIIDGINMDGLTLEEGKLAVVNAVNARDASWYVNLTYNGETRATITASFMGISTDVNSVLSVLNQAWAVGHVGYIFDRKADLDQQNRAQLILQTTQSQMNTSALDSLIGGLAGELYRSPSDASLVGFDPSNAIEPFTYYNEVYGQSLDAQALQKQILDAYTNGASGEIAVTPTVLEPAVTRANLEKLVTLRATGYTPVSKDSTENRTNNIRQCFVRFSGTVLAPGAKLSFNSTVGRRTKANGFFEAPEYAYGELVTGVGGGSCQASTTLYLAAACAGLEIVDRTAHSDPVNYTELGKDATVYYTNDKKIDLVIRNNTANPIYIAAEVTTDPRNSKRLVCYVRIYGETLGDGVSYRLDSRLVQTISAPVIAEEYKDENATYVTYTDERKLVIKARDGQVVETYLQRIENNHMMAETLISTDTYKARAARYYVGVIER